jgi:hypothetical protein
MTDMASIGYNNRWVRLLKDLIFVALGCFLIWRGGFFVTLLGLFGMIWYGRDAYYQAKVLWQDKHYEPQARETSAPKASADGGKITISTDAKEVDFEKE